jgi:hypothetical protein
LLQLELLGRVKVSLQATTTASNITATTSTITATASTITATATATATAQRLLELRALFLAQGIDSLL